MQKNYCLPPLLFSVFSVLLIAPLHAQESPNSARNLPATHLTKSTPPPVLDGDLSDTAWQSASVAETFYDRLKGNPTTDDNATKAYFLYDDTYLYVAFSCKDSQPDQITARETVRDSRFNNAGVAGVTGEFTEDHVDVRLDPFLSFQDSEIAIFSVNPLGTLSFKGGGGKAVKREWQGDWEAKTKRLPDGWSAEIKIPWAALNHPSAPKFNMGINFFRFQNRTRIHSCWSNVGQEFFLQRAGRLTNIALEKNVFQPQLSLLPYVLGAAQEKKNLTKGGLDVRYTATPTLTGVASLHPDFGNIEGAVEGIAFSRSERFVEERRPFFAEGANYLSQGSTNDLGAFFYPVRRIADFDTGLKVFGKISPVDTLGVLATTDNFRNDIIARYRRDLNPTTNVGAFFSQKAARNDPTTSADERDSNNVSVLFGNTRKNKLILQSQLASSQGTKSGGAAGLAQVKYQEKLSSTTLTYRNVAADFRAANGLIPFVDFRGYSLTHDWSNEWRQGTWRSFRVIGHTNWDTHQNGKEFRRGADIQGLWQTRSDWLVGAFGEYVTFDRLLDNSYSLILVNGVTNRFRQYTLDMGKGRQNGLPFEYVSPGVNLRLLNALDLGYTSYFRKLDGFTRQNIITANYLLSKTQSIGGRWVQNGDKSNTYVSFRNSAKKGTETWFLIGDPNSAQFVKKATLKFVFAY
jgi:Carbohydrate family 9 binding domain-like/Domain of unknown function (DUF5916)